MNLDNAIAAHVQWKTKFRVAITAQQTLDAATIGKDNCCELGQWLHGAGRGTYGSRPEFVSLLEKHKSFHKEAGLVATAINGKKFDQASSMIEVGTPFTAASNAVGVAVNALKRAIA
jgi:methyl-accepting chemotaxis protein